MKILFTTHAFYPAVGGLEGVGRVLAEEFVAQGHEVCLVTPTPARSPADDTLFPFPILRQPAARALLDRMRWCDVFYQHNISLRTLWPRLFVRRPVVMSFHTWITREDGSDGWQDRFKRWAVRRLPSPPIAVSRAVAASLPRPAAIIGNPYQDDLFRTLPGVPRDRQLVFLGRLVSDKGIDVLLESLVELRRLGLTPDLTIIGDGPDAGSLRRLAERLTVQDQVTFTGPLTGEALVEMLNRHRIMVAPSRLPEPFGVVALEGIACGCAVVASEPGGLRDAAGPCGLFFPNGDVPALAAALARLVPDEALRLELWSHAGEHLGKHQAKRVAAAYLQEFEKALRWSTSP